jgi:hypothetical protein
VSLTDPHSAGDPRIEDDLRSAALTRWPFQDRPFGDVVAWRNLELMRNAAEIGYVRLLQGARALGARPALHFQWVTRCAKRLQ